jgi:hypothetical protein
MMVAYLTLGVVIIITVALGYFILEPIIVERRQTKKTQANLERLVADLAARLEPGQSRLRVGMTIADGEIDDLASSLSVATWSLSPSLRRSVQRIFDAYRARQTEAQVAGQTAVPQPVGDVAATDDRTQGAQTGAAPQRAAPAIEEQRPTGQTEPAGDGGNVAGIGGTGGTATAASSDGGSPPASGDDDVTPPVTAAAMPLSPDPPPTLAQLHERWVNEGAEGRVTGLSGPSTLLERLAIAEPDPALHALWRQALAPASGEEIARQVLQGVDICVGLIARRAKDREAVRQRLDDVSRIYLSTGVDAAALLGTSSRPIDELIAGTEQLHMFAESTEQSVVILPRLGQPLRSYYAALGSIDDANLFMLLGSAPYAANVVRSMWNRLHIRARLGQASLPNPSAAKFSGAMLGGLEGTLGQWAAAGTQEHLTSDDQQAEIALPVEPQRLLSVASFARAAVGN